MNVGEPCLSQELLLREGLIKVVSTSQSCVCLILQTSQFSTKLVLKWLKSYILDLSSVFRYVIMKANKEV